MKHFPGTGGTAALAALLLAAAATPSLAGSYSLTVDPVEIDLGHTKVDGVGYNGASPGPVLRFREGEDVTIAVTNNLKTSTSIHWHGLILPFRQDGVPTISFDGIAPGETFTYRFPIVQSGTYWYHSHSGMQEPEGAYGAIVIEPKEREPFRYDRDYVVQLTDRHPHSAHRIMRNLKAMPDYYNRIQRTAGDFFDEVAKNGLGATLSDRADWGEMRMMPTDIEDVQGFTPLINGRTADQNWTGLFRPGERVRLRFINSSAMSYFDIRIPGLKMTVVAADGNNVRPVTVDELRIAVAETYDVIVRPTEDKAYTVFAESMGRTAYARGTLAPREGMSAEIPAMRSPPRLTMADMGMAHEGMDHGSMGHGSTGHGTGQDGSAPSGHGMMGHGGASGMPMQGMAPSGQGTMGHDMMGHGSMGHGTMGQGMSGHGGPASSGHGGAAPSGHGGMDHSGHAASGGAADPFYAAGSGLTPTAADDGGKVLSYADLKAQKPLYPHREATREIAIRLTGNMERYIWSLDGVKYGDAEPIRLRYGERVRFTFVNETMMTHPMHLHGMWSILDNGSGKWNPAKHVISVAPGTTVSMETEVDAPGEWAFHCHLAYHAASGMFRKIVVEGGPQAANLEGAR